MQYINTFILIICLFLISNLSVASEIEIDSYYQTSTADGYEDVRCAFVGDCKVGWKPQSSDSGALEGVFFKLKRPFRFDFLQSDISNYIVLIEIAGSETNATIFLDGKADNMSLHRNQQFLKSLNEVVTNIPISKGSQLLVFWNQDSWGDLFVRQAQSFFIRFNQGNSTPVIKRIRIVKLSEDNIKKEDENDVVHLKSSDLKFKLPKYLSISNIKASSILEPKFAYQPANLFDGIPALAFSFNGKKNDGKDEFLNLTWNEKLNISGLRIFNGYQRSKAHFQANSRIKTLEVTNKKHTDIVNVQDKYGYQDVHFKLLLQNTNEISFKVKEIFAGSKYKDLLISELYLIDNKIGLIKPSVEKFKPAVEKLNWFIDRTWISQAGDLSPVDLSEDKNFKLTFDQSFKKFSAIFRFRSNGTFVIYTRNLFSQINPKDKVQNKKASEINIVMEGNWIYNNNKITMFGRKYNITTSKNEVVKTDQSAYRGYEVLSDNNNETQSDGIFKSEVNLARLNELSPEKKKTILDFLKKQNKDDFKEDSVSKTNPLIFMSDVLTSNFIEIDKFNNTRN